MKSKESLLTLLMILMAQLVLGTTTVSAEDSLKRLVINTSEHQFAHFPLTLQPGNYAVNLTDFGSLSDFGMEELRTIVLLGDETKLRLNAPGSSNLNVPVEATYDIYLYAVVDAEYETGSYSLEIKNAQTQEDAFVETVSINKDQPTTGTIDRLYEIDVLSAGAYTITLNSFDIFGDGFSRFEAVILKPGLSDPIPTEVDLVQSGGFYQGEMELELGKLRIGLVMELPPGSNEFSQFAIDVSDQAGVTLFETSESFATQTEEPNSRAIQFDKIQLSGGVEGGDKTYRVTIADHQFSGSLTPITFGLFDGDQEIVRIEDLQLQGSNPRSFTQEFTIATTNDFEPVLIHPKDATGIFSMLIEDEDGIPVTTPIYKTFGNVIEMDKTQDLLSNSNHDLEVFDYGIASAAVFSNILLLQNQEELARSAGTGNSTFKLDGNDPVRLFIEADSDTTSIIKVNIESSLTSQELYSKAFQIGPQEFQPNVEPVDTLITNGGEFEIFIKDYAFPTSIGNSSLHVLGETSTIASLQLGGGSDFENGAPLNIELTAGEYFIAVVTRTGLGFSSLLGYRVTQLSDGTEDTPPDTTGGNIESPQQNRGGGGGGGGAFGALLYGVIIFRGLFVIFGYRRRIRN